MKKYYQNKEKRNGNASALLSALSDCNSRMRSVRNCTGT